MRDYYLAVDIGASSGRHILASLNDGKLELEEIHRFDNGMIKKDGHLCWDVAHLFQEIVTGLKECKHLGKIPKSVSVDTWGVDYVLLDDENHIVGETYGYRDHRTKGMDVEVNKFLSQEELYQRTGIAKQSFNTIYQLMSVKMTAPEQLQQAKTILLLPDYFHFMLTGNKVSEYTNATTGQLVNVHTKQWDYELIDKLGLNPSMFLPLSQPGTVVGELTKEMQEEVGFTCKVILPATHDTASAVMSVPSLTDECLYISSGTWSLMGIEHSSAICTEESRTLNFTNEGGYNYRYRFLKNIMGLWMIQSVRHERNDQYSFASLCQMAEEEKEFPSRVDVNDDCFLAPESMIEAIKEYCQTTNQPVPETIGQIAAVIYQSLAECYGSTVAQIEQLSGQQFDSIHIVGGGSNAAYLNQLTADQSGKVVYAGPSEATAIGNVSAQMIQDGVYKDLKEAREHIYHSFAIKKYVPAMKKEQVEQ